MPETVRSTGIHRGVLHPDILAHMRRSILPLVLLAACNPKPQEEATVAPEPAASVAPVETEEPVDPEAEAAAERERELERARNAPPPAGLAAGLVSDFESGELRSEFGAGWQKGTDEMEGGASTVEIDVVEDGPDGSPMTMRIKGTIDEGSLPDAWAGAMFFPGNSPMSPANLLSKPVVTFHARGEGPLMVKVFAEQKGTTPVTTTVEIGEEWGRHEVDLKTLVADPYDVTAIVFGVPAKAGTWTVWVDDIRLK